jgi:hypothetical protein
MTVVATTVLAPGLLIYAVTPCFEFVLAVLHLDALILADYIWLLVLVLSCLLLLWPDSFCPYPKSLCCLKRHPS